MATKYTNSPLVVYTKLSPNYGSRIIASNPNGTISRITLHHMAGNCTIEVCASVFATSARQASSNYGIGTDGRIGLYVEEKNRAWTSSSRENDSRAVTVEIANNSGNPNWTISDKALASAIALCVDICKRNNIAKLTYTGKLSGANLTQHKWFAATGCPGPYLGGKFPYIVEQVNAKLAIDGPSTGIEGEIDIVDPTHIYRVRKSWEDSESQIGAFAELNNAKAVADSHAGYYVFDWEGNRVYPGVAEVVPPVTPEVISNQDEWMWNFLDAHGFSDYAKAGIMGNAFAESALKANNLQQTYESKLGYTDDTYTAAVDAGTYTNFVNDKAGYGFFQWTFYTRKQALLDFAKNTGRSIGSPTMQMEFFCKEVQSFKEVVEGLKSATSVRQASDIMLLKFECPADMSESAQIARANFSQKYYDKYATQIDEPVTPEVDNNTVLEYKVGDIVNFVGTVQYANSAASSGIEAQPCRAKVTSVAKQSKHPYHLRAVDLRDVFISGKVYGWVDSNAVEPIIKSVDVPDYEVKVTANHLNIRKGPGTNYDKCGIASKCKFVIVEEADGQGATKWGKLADNLGWISLDYVDKCTDEAVPPPTDTFTEAQLEAVARRVIRGEFGNGTTRVAKLEAAGYPYQAVQDIVDKIMSGTYKPNTQKKSNEEIAREVLKGIWGSGTDRVNRLKAAGYDPKVIQDIVNSYY